MTSRLKDDVDAKMAAARVIEQAITSYRHYSAAINLTAVKDVSEADCNRLLDKLGDELKDSLAAFLPVDRAYRAWLRDQGFRFRRITSKQITLVQIAKRDLELTDYGYRVLLTHIGFTDTATKLDNVGFEWLMFFFKATGFEPTTAKKRGENFGRRTAMASPAQVDLIRALWLEWSRADEIDEAPLNAWLGKFHAVSALRFVDAAKAGKVINALRAVTARTAVSVWRRGGSMPAPKEPIRAERGGSTLATLLSTPSCRECSPATPPCNFGPQAA